MDSQARRRERRKAKQEEYKHSNPLAVGIYAKPSVRPLLTLNRKVNRVEKALIARDEVIFDSADNRCLPEVALYAAGHRNTRKEAVHIIK